MSTLLEHWPEIVSLILAIAALAVSVKAWQKSRAIYRVERTVIRQYTGDRNDLNKNENDLNEKLSSGEYTILTVTERTKSDNDWEVLLGRIKPDKSNKNRVESCSSAMNNLSWKMRLAISITALWVGAWAFDLFDQRIDNAFYGLFLPGIIWAIGWTVARKKWDGKPGNRIAILAPICPQKRTLLRSIVKNAGQLREDYSLIL